MELTEAINALQDLVNYERGFQKYDAGNYQPDKVRRMLDERGIDISPLRFIHVAGTNGKGSVSLYAANLLNSSGHKAGLYTSPHLFTPLERIAVAGTDIPESKFCALVKEFIDYFRETGATYFEALTFAAVVYFLREGCDFAVLETGLGGRLDSTNFCLPEVSVITPIGFDHTQLLGGTLAKIAVEKAGIVKPGIPVVVSPQAPEAMDALIGNAASKGSPVVRFDESVSYSITKRDADGSVFDASLPKSELKNVRFARMGDRLVENFLTAVLALFAAGVKVDRRAIDGSARVHQHFRCELYRGAIIDVAHNPPAIAALFDTLNKYLPGKPVRLHIGILADKELERVATTLRENAGQFERITVFDFETLDGKRPSGGKRLFELIEMTENIDYLPSLDELTLDMHYLNVFAGSFYAVSRIMQLLDNFSTSL